MEHEPEPTERPLPATITFVALVGAFIVIGWLVMFDILVHRW